MTAVICIIIKNEHSYLKEWVEYHLNIGFSKIFIYEDYGSDSHYDILQPFIDNDKVVLTNLEQTKIVPKANLTNRINGKATQGLLYDYFVEKCKKDNTADWVGFFDVDEFLMFNDGYNLNSLLKEFNEYSGIMLSWRLYGANEHVKKPNCGVIEAYPIPCPINTFLDGERWNHKSLINIHKITGHTSVHDWIDDDGNIVDNLVFTDYVNSLIHTCYDKAYIAHYYTKSFEEYTDRMLKRGNMGNNSRCFDNFFRLSPDLRTQEKELLDSIRFNSYGGETLYISHKHQFIAGGNKTMLKQLRQAMI